MCFPLGAATAILHEGGISVQASGRLWAITVIFPEKEWLFQQKVSMRKLTSVILTNNVQWSTFRLPIWFRSVNFAILMMLHDTCRAMMKRLTLQYIIYMKRKTNLLIAACMALSPALMGTEAAAQTFEKLFEWAPDYYADINDDGKQEYFLYGKWRTLAGEELCSLPDGMGVNAMVCSMFYITANPVPGFASAANNYYKTGGDVFYMKDGKYVITKAYEGDDALMGATWADINLDGRMDVLYWKNEAINQGYVYVPYVKMLCADGTFVDQPLEVVTDMDELQGAMDATGGNGTFSVSNNSSFSGFCSGKGVSFPVGPMNVVDLNQDGYPDFIDEKGFSYLSLGDGRYYLASIAARKVRAGDVNGDGLTDLLVYDGNELKLKLNTGQGFKDVSLLSNNNLRDVYMLDCDGDGHLDILAAVTAEDASFLAFFRNQGNGTFKRTVRSFEELVNWEAPYFINNNGLPSMVSYADGDLMCWNWDASFNVEKVALTSGVRSFNKFFLLDVDGDGKIDMPGQADSKEFGIFHCKVEKANTPPARMQAPKLLLDKSTGLLRAEWEHGTDAENSAGDLSYEFEITSPSGEYLFRTFTKSLFTLASAGSWGTSSVQARVRAIDGSGMKGKWSDVAKQDGILAVPSVALICPYNASTGDTVFVHELSGMKCEMKGLPDGRLVTDKDGRKGFVFASHGTKKIELAAQNGMTISRRIELQPVRVESTYLNYSAKRFGLPSDLGFCFDFAQLGALQAMAGSGYYKWNGHKYEKQPVFDFSDGAPAQFVFDANMDGLPDPAEDNLYLGQYSLKVAVNQGDGDFLKSTVSGEFSGSGNIYSYMDINNDGLMERFYRGYDGNHYFYRTDMNEGLVKTDYMDLGDQSKNIDFCLDVCADFDRDGRLDILGNTKGEDGYPYWAILFNEGNGRWTVKHILQTNEPLADIVVYDVDGDGYVDIVRNYWTRKAVSRNRGNREFADWEELDGYLLKMDIDQDGLADLQLSDDGRSVIVSNHGSPVQVPMNFDLFRSDFADINNDGVPDYIDIGGSVIMRIANNNTAPTAPTTLIATQTADEVIISWDGATDKESTTSQLRYNISIKEKGATGDDAYIWSPLNATSNQARMSLVPGIPTYYRQATKLPMPISRFQAGKTYEICVQAIDPWYASSPFSKVIEFTPQAECHITLPAKAGVDEYVAYRTVSNVQGALSIRQAEGMDLSKAGYIKWNTPGVKTVVTTNTNSMIKSTTQILIVDKPNLDVQIPARALAGQTLVVDMPECMRNVGAKVSVTSDEAKVAYDANSNKAVVTLPEQDGDCQLTITYADDVWQKAITRNYNINVVGQNWTPQIAQVKVADGHSVIQWDEQNLPAPELFTGMVNIYRESDIADSYDLIAQVPMSQGKYVDEQSHSEVCSYRYQMTLSTIYGVETLSSTVHATMHVLANRGLGNDINIRWTPYEGTTVAQYVVYAGTSPDNMQLVDRLSGYARSYVHHRNSDATTYYAVGFVAKSELSGKAKAKTIANDEIVSNIISSADAYSVNAVQSIEIATREEEATFTQERLTLHLLAYVTPSQASIGKVEWSLLAGESLVNLSDDGVMQLIPGTKGGEVVVQAKAIDGSGITATRTFAVPQVSGVESVEANADGVKISAMLGGVRLTGITNPTDVIVTTANGTVVYRSILAADHRIALSNGLYIVRAGNRVGKVMVR